MHTSSTMASSGQLEQPPPSSIFVPHHPVKLSNSTSRWWSKECVAIVTGANKGIGYALVKRLAELGLAVVLTARDQSRGSKAMESLKLLGLHHNVHFCLLDISDPTSIQSFVSWFQTRFHALDILVNNAAVCFNTMTQNTVEHAETVLKTNYYGSKLLTEELLPFFRCSTSMGRILNISSRLGSLDKLKNQEIKDILGNEETLSEEDIERVVRAFLHDAKEGRWEGQGWPEIWTDYSVSKIALNAYSKVLARRLCRGSGISVNCFCPGFTQTSMTEGKGKHSADDAANMVAALALLPPQHLTTGKFYAASTSRGICSKL